MVNKVFQSQIGRNLEVYVDYLITKSKQASQHAANLRETFNTLRKYQMRLNTEKVRVWSHRWEMPWFPC